MKAVLIIYAPALEQNVMKALAQSGVKKYTKLPYLHGVGGHSEPHLDTQVWPGSNESLLIVTDEKTKDKLTAAVALIKKDFGFEGIKCFVWTIEEEI